MDKEEELLKLTYISKKLNKTSNIVFLGFIFFIISYLTNLILLFLWVFGYILNVIMYGIATIFWIYGIIYVNLFLMKVLIVSRLVESRNLKRFMFLYSFSLELFTLTFVYSYFDLWQHFFIVFPAVEDFFYSPVTLNGIWTLFKSQLLILVIGLLISGLIQAISWNDLNMFLKDFPDSDIFVKKKNTIKRNRIYAIISMIPILNIAFIPYIIRSMRVFNNPNEWNVDKQVFKRPDNPNMDSIKCPKCGAIIAKMVEFCPECGQKMSQSS